MTDAPLPPVPAKTSPWLIVGVIVTLGIGYYLWQKQKKARAAVETAPEPEQIPEGD